MNHVLLLLPLLQVAILKSDGEATESPSDLVAIDSRYASSGQTPTWAIRGTDM